jgi:hypothetical protein
MRILLRLYLDALVKGNPFAVALTVVGAVALSVGPFYEGVSRRDPVAIAMMAGVGVMFAIVLAVAVIDRKLNPKKPRPTAPKSRPASRAAGRR